MNRIRENGFGRHSKLQTQMRKSLCEVYVLCIENLLQGESRKICHVQARGR